MEWFTKRVCAEWSNFVEITYMKAGERDELDRKLTLCRGRLDNCEIALVEKQDWTFGDKEQLGVKKEKH